MIELRIPASLLRDLGAHLLEGDVERCAVLLASGLTQGRPLLLVNEAILPESGDYLRQSQIAAELAPAFVAKVTKRAKAQGQALVFVHTHPGSIQPHFSLQDDAGERELRAFVERRALPGTHAALVIGEVGCRCRVLGGNEEIRVVSIGDVRRVEFEPTHEESEPAEQRFDRQVRAFGAAGQRVMRSLRVGVVGLGGTGSIAVQELVHLGVRDFVLIDPDHLEATNLNRVVGATPTDVGVPKVGIARRQVRQIQHDAQVQAIQGDVAHTSTANRLRDVDFIFCCTDSHGSRSVVQQIAYQYLIPCIDVGSTIIAADNEVKGIFGRVQLLGPDQACLWCSGLLSSEEVRRDLMSETERKTDPYIPGAREPAPAVISLNATVVSLGVTMFLGVVAGIPVSGRHLIYNAMTSTVRSAKSRPQDECFICSPQGALARGEQQPLYARQE